MGNLETLIRAALQLLGTVNWLRIQAISDDCRPRRQWLTR